MSFRFEQLDIWKSAIDVSAGLFELAERAQKLHKYRFAEQLNGAVLSVSNNIAEGSGAATSKEFARYLAIARSSVFETVNLLYIYKQQSIISEDEYRENYNKLLKLSKQIQSFRKTLLKNN